MIRLAYRNLFQNKVRLVASVGGIALALMLILALDAIFTGVEKQITAYIDHSGADLFVSQEGVRNMHMASSSLPSSMKEKIAAEDGVRSVVPILYLTNMVVVGDQRNLAYIIGVPDGAKYGSASNVSSGAAVPDRGETIIDRRVAEKSDVGLGDKVKILGRSFKIAGLSEGTASLINSVAFINLSDFQEIRGGQNTVSFFLVQVQPGITSETVAARLEKDLGNATVLTRTAFSSNERQVVRDMSTDIITIMNLVGFLIGLAVMSLTVYTAALSRQKEYGVLKAIGARNSALYESVIVQSILSVILGLVVGIAFTELVALVTPRLGIGLTLILSPSSLFKAAAVSFVIAALSAVLPVRQIAQLDPALVFRGK
jgi:putative ABC transport system permease protein